MHGKGEAADEIVIVMPPCGVKSQFSVANHIASLTDEELEREIMQLLSGVALPAH